MDSEKQDKIARIRKKRWKRLYLIMSVIFAVFVLGLSIAGLLVRDRTYSEQENRMLAEMPALTLEGIRNKSFMTDLEDYTADQFIGRDLWISLKTWVDLSLGKRGAEWRVPGKGPVSH
ncbi:MAG: hypothetical protein LUG62_06375 [Clostridiales bacterium]|nr:hypothetical protein [Clostridiales bacterium]